MIVKKIIIFLLTKRGKQYHAYEKKNLTKHKPRIEIASNKFKNCKWNKYIIINQTAFNHHFKSFLNNLPIPSLTASIGKNTANF